jgi:DNA-binding protein HU-beta
MNAAATVDQDATAVETETTGKEMLSRKELAKGVAELYEIPTSLAERIIVTVFEEIAESVLMGTSVSLPGFGKFKAIVKPARTARNPSTGGTVDVPEKNAIKFSPSLTLKKAIAGIEE